MKCDPSLSRVPGWDPSSVEGAYPEPPPRGPAREDRTAMIANTSFVLPEADTKQIEEQELQIKD